MVGTIVKTNIGELEEEVRAVFSRRMRKEFTGVFQGIYGKNQFLARFQDGCKKDLTSNQLAIMIAENILVEEEPKVPTITEIPEEQVTLYKGYYQGVYVIIYFKKEVSSDRKEDQVDVED